MTTPRPKRATRPAWTAAIALVALASLACAASAELHRVVLDNGLTLVVLPNPWSRTAAISVMVGAGSKYDPDGLEGLAQITNEFFFEGIGDEPWNEVYDELSAQGVEVKCLTSEDTAEILLTGYEARFDYMVDRLAAALTLPAFNAERLEHEQGVARSSYDSEMADDWKYSYRSLVAHLYDGHPYMTTPLGTPAGIEAVDVPDLVEFYEQFYTPANTIVVAVGDLMPEPTLARLEDAFEPYDGPGEPPLPIPVPERTGMTVAKLLGGEREDFVQIGYAGPKPSETDDLPALRVLMAVLGAGTDSRLYRMLGQSEEEISATGAFASHRAEQVRLLIYAMKTSGTEIVESILGEVERMKVEPPSAEELERAKENVIGNFVLHMQRNSEKASAIARDHFLGLPVGCCDSYIAETEEVTADEVRAAAERYLVNPAVVFQRAGTAPAKRGI